jgi:acetyl esterase/lipase
MRVSGLLACAFLAVSATTVEAQPPPAAIFTDPPADAAHPARSEVLHIPSGGVTINGLAYIPAGAGPHPTAVIFHGLPGNEKNLDLAQAVRRAGWTAVTVNYRGSWGSPGHYRFKGTLEDAKAVLAYLRDPTTAAKLQIDPHRLVIMGHSLGGWVTAMTGGADADVAGAVLISAADMGRTSAMSKADRVALAADNMESLADVTAESMADDLATLGGLGFATAAPGLARHPLLVITSDDGLADQDHALATDVAGRGGKVAERHFAADHSYNQSRIALESTILTWLAALPK